MNTQIADNKTSDILLNRIKHYYQCSIWLLRDGLEAFQKQIVFILSLNILGVALAGIGLSGIFLVVKHLENKKSFQLYGLEFHFSTSILEVLVLIIACIALGLLSACILYYTERTIADTTAAYQKHCILKVAKIAGDPDYDGWQILADQSPQKNSGRPLRNYLSDCFFGIPQPFKRNTAPDYPFICRVVHVCY